MLDQEQQRDLAPGEAQRLERGQVTKLAEHPAAGRVGQRERGGHQPDHAEQRQQRAQQPVVQLHGGSDLAPGVDALQAVLQHDDHALRDHLGRLGVGQA